MTSTDFSKLKIWTYLEEVLVNDTSDSADTQILDAKMKKIENWKVHKTFQEVANEGQSTISAGWRRETKQKKIFIKRDSFHAVLSKLKRITSEKIRQNVAKRISE